MNHYDRLRSIAEHMSDPYALIDSMAFSIIDEHRMKRPEEYAGYSGEGNQHCINDTKYHLRFLFDAASIGSPPAVRRLYCLGQGANAAPRHIR